MSNSENMKNLSMKEIGTSVDCSSSVEEMQERFLEFQYLKVCIEVVLEEFRKLDSREEMEIPLISSFYVNQDSSEFIDFLEENKDEDSVFLSASLMESMEGLVDACRLIFMESDTDFNADVLLNSDIKSQTALLLKLLRGTEAELKALAQVIGRKGGFVDDSILMN